MSLWHSCDNLGQQGDAGKLPIPNYPAETFCLVLIGKSEYVLQLWCWLRVSGIFENIFLNGCNACSYCVMKVIVSEERCHDATPLLPFLVVLFVWVAGAVGRWDLPSTRQRQDLLSCEDWWVHFTSHRQKALSQIWASLPLMSHETLGNEWNLSTVLPIWRKSLWRQAPLLHTHSDPAARNQRLLIGQCGVPLCGQFIITWTIYIFWVSEEILRYAEQIVYEKSWRMIMTLVAIMICANWWKSTLRWLQIIHGHKESPLYLHTT